MRKQKPNTAAIARQVVEWNAAHPVGAKVVVRLDSGAGFETTTRSEAWVVGDHSAVVSVVGISGGYRLDRVTPVMKEASEHAQ